MMESLIQLDQAFFSFLNGMHSPWLDELMVLVSGKYFWIPLYALLLVLMVRQFKKKSIVLVLGIVAMVVTTDQVSRAVKYAVERPRPSHEQSLETPAHIVNNHRGGKFGFFSSHASNVFGIATFFTSLLSRRFKNIGWPLFVWASIVSYSRIYLGVHYPLDIFVGMLLGLCVGYGYSRLLKRHYLKTA